MKYILLLTIATCMAACQKKNNNEIIYENMLIDFEGYVEAARLHLSKRNIDSAFWYSGRMNENLKIRKMLFQ